MKKTVAFISSLVMMTAVFVSCGKKDDDDSKGSKGGKSGNKLIGTWELDKDSYDTMDFGIDIDNAEFIFGDKEVEMKASVDSSEMMNIKGDSFVFFGESFDYDYDGKALSIQENGESLVFDRIDSADESNVYGKYKNDELAASFKGGEMYIDFSEEGVSYMVVSMNQEYTYDEKKGVIITKGDDGEDDEDKITIDGDKLTIESEEEGTMTFTRKK